MNAETGRVDFNRLVGDSIVAGSEDVEAFFASSCRGSDVLDALEMESRSLWNFRLVVLRAVGILEKERQTKRNVVQGQWWGDAACET